MAVQCLIETRFYLEFTAELQQAASEAGGTLDQPAEFVRVHEIYPVHYDAHEGRYYYRIYGDCPDQPIFLRQRPYQTVVIYDHRHDLRIQAETLEEAQRQHRTAIGLPSRTITDE